MREIDLREYATSAPLTLSVDERDALARHFSVAVAPAVGTADEYTLTPGSVVGAVEIGGLSVRIAPKIGIGGLLSLACYATGKVELQAREFDFPEQSALPDALARASGFLMDMNRVFQEFVTVALREALGVSEREFGERSIGPLDMEGRVSLKPDLTWRDGSRCMFVGDVKYKRMEAGVPNADLYQLLAYAIALDLPGGLLIYAQGEQEPATHTVRHAGKRLEVAALDLSGALEATLARVGDLAQRVTGLRRVA